LKEVEASIFVVQQSKEIMKMSNVWAHSQMEDHNNMLLEAK
jgi:hypothetical protein